MGRGDDTIWPWEADDVDLSRNTLTLEMYLGQDYSTT